MQHGIKRHVKNSARRRNLLESHGIFRLHVSRPASISSTPLFLSLVITNHLKVPLSARFVRDCSPPHLAARDSQSQGILGLQMDLTSNQCNFFFSGLFFFPYPAIMLSFFPRTMTWWCQRKKQFLIPQGRQWYPPALTLPSLQTAGKRH